MTKLSDPTQDIHISIYELKSGFVVRIYLNNKMVREFLAEERKCIEPRILEALDHIVHLAVWKGHPHD